MYGLVTRNEEETDWPEFDLSFYEVKGVSGRSSEPIETAVSTISCFGDNAAVAENPALAPIDPDGRRATRDHEKFDWAHVCPTHEEYRRGLLEMIEDAGAVSGDVRLDDVGFPRPEYCYCDRCNHAFESWAERRYSEGNGPPPAETTVEDRRQWRRSVMTDFVAEATDRIPGRSYLTLYPDPYGRRLYERSGLDLETLSTHVDAFVVPLYDTAYGTTYWLEAIAAAFEDRVSVPLHVELYAVDVDIDALIDATAVAAEYADSVLFGYDGANARAALRRMDADAREGVEW
ncbi:MAG: hypothetical protein PPP58_09895 [Natronomonas sp.]